MKPGGQGKRWKTGSLHLTLLLTVAAGCRSSQERRCVDAQGNVVDERLCGPDTGGPDGGSFAHRQGGPGYGFGGYRYLYYSSPWYGGFWGGSSRPWRSGSSGGSSAGESHGGSVSRGGFGSSASGHGTSGSSGGAHGGSSGGGHASGGS